MPALNAISVDKTVVDVSNGPQTVTFSFDAYDASGIDYSIIFLDTPSSIVINSSERDDNLYQENFTLDSTSPSGNYEIRSMYLYDIFGNYVQYDKASLLNFGLPSYIEVIDENFQLNFDFDKNGTLDALTDGLLLLRYAFGLRSDNLTNAAIDLDSTLTTEEIEKNIEQALDIADIDNDGTVSALTDGLLLLRYFFGLRGESLVNDVVSLEATRTSASEIGAYIESYLP